MADVQGGELGDEERVYALLFMHETQRRERRESLTQVS